MRDQRACDRIEIGKDYVTISDERGEVVHWVKDEWTEDSDVLTSITNAIRIAFSGKSTREFLENATP